MTAALGLAREIAPADAPVCIARCGVADMAGWNRYVEGHPDGSPFHLFGWAVIISAAYGYEPLFLAAKRDEKIVGVLPLIDVRSPLLGRALVSTAFTVGGGPLGEDDEIIKALAAAAAQLGEERRVQYVEFRSHHDALADWIPKTGKYATFLMRLPEDENEHLQSLPKRRRAEIRKAAKAESEGALRCYVSDDVDRFYAMYAWSVRRLGTPVFPKRYLDEMLRVFGGRVELFFVDNCGAPAAALLSFYFKDRVYPYFMGAAPCARDCRAYEWICWSLMRRAAAHGVRAFDFGRSKVGGGAYHFKKLWGLSPEPLIYQTKLVAAHTAADVSPTNPKFTGLSALWKRLPPPMANRLGPFLARNFP